MAKTVNVRVALPSVRSTNMKRPLAVVHRIAYVVTVRLSALTTSTGQVVEGLAQALAKLVPPVRPTNMK